MFIIWGISSTLWTTANHCQMPQWKSDTDKPEIPPDPFVTPLFWLLLDETVVAWYSLTCAHSLVKAWKRTGSWGSYQRCRVCGSSKTGRQEPSWDFWPLSFWPFRCNFMLLHSTSLFTFFLLFFSQGLTNTVCDFWVRNVSLILSESKGVKFSCIFTFWILLGEKKSLRPLFPFMIYMACLLWVLAVHYASHFPPLVYDHWVCLASVHLTFVYCSTQRFAGVMNLHGDLWHPTVFYSV